MGTFIVVESDTNNGMTGHELRKNTHDALVSHLNTGDTYHCSMIKYTGQGIKVWYFTHARWQSLVKKTVAKLLQRAGSTSPEINVFKSEKGSYVYKAMEITQEQFRVAYLDPTTEKIREDRLQEMFGPVVAAVVAPMVAPMAAAGADGEGEGEDAEGSDAEVDANNSKEDDMQQADDLLQAADQLPLPDAAAWDAPHFLAAEQGQDAAPMALNVASMLIIPDLQHADVPAAVVADAVAADEQGAQQQAVAPAAVMLGAEAADKQDEPQEDVPATADVQAIPAGKAQQADAVHAAKLCLPSATPQRIIALAICLLVLLPALCKGPSNEGCAVMDKDLYVLLLVQPCIPIILKGLGRRKPLTQSYPGHTWYPRA